LASHPRGAFSRFPFPFLGRLLFPTQNIAATSHNSLTVLFEGTSWERLKHVFVDREGEHIYALRPKVDKVTHRLLCDVKLVENVKVVTFRSTLLIENCSLVNAEMVVVDENGKRASQIYKIRESQIFPPWSRMEVTVAFSSSRRRLCRANHRGVHEPH
jgi:hypothetical protein